MNPQEAQLRARVDEVREKLDGLTADLRVVDDEFESLAPERARHEALDQACASLEKLEELGAAELFWGGKIAPARIEEQLRGARERARAFREQLDALEARRREIESSIGGEEQVLEVLDEDLYEIREQEERKKLEWIVEREETPVAYRPQKMAWARGGHDDRRFYKTLGGALLTSVILGALLPMIDLPMPKRFVPEDMPKRLAKLVRPELPKPAKLPPVIDETKPEPVEPDPEPKPTDPAEEPPPEQTQIAKADTPPVEAPPKGAVDAPPGPGPARPSTKRVQKAGILAFRDKFASLPKDDVAPKLGRDARFGDADDVSRAATRAMLTTNAPGSSGGIDVGALSRNVGGGGGAGGTGEGGGIHGVPLGKAHSSIAQIGGGGRPLARDGAVPSRTDEEIQIVFDRYKASFYRLYNRELRNDPTLRGQMVLRLTIEPDGSVSMCELDSTDMDAPTLADRVVARVKTIDFGAKEGVRALTIVYPIDFLPAA